MRTKRLSAEQRKLSIIEATIRVVARLNYDRATTALIAKEAEINQATIYKYFKSKQDLQIVMLDYIHHFLDEKHLINPELITKIERTDFLKFFTVRFHSNLKQDARLRACIIKAMVAIDKRISDKVWEIIKEKHTALVRHLEQYFRAHLGEGRFDSYDLEMMAWSFIASDMFFTGLTLMGKSDEVPKEKIYRAIEVMEKVMLQQP